MDIALGMSLEVDEQFVCALHGVAQVEIERGVAHKESESTVVAIELGSHLLHVVESEVYAVPSALDINLAEVARDGLGIIHHIVCLGHKLW